MSPVLFNPNPKKMFTSVCTGRDASLSQKSSDTASKSATKDSSSDNREGDRPAKLERDENSESSEPSDGWTPYQKLNTAVYAVLISVLFIVFEKEYGGIVSTSLRHYFPREASALGFPPLRKS